MTILALDLGTHCGWCRTDGIVYDSGVWNLTGGRYEGGGMRFLRFRQMLDSLGWDAQLVVYEEVRRHMGVDAAHVYGGFQAVLTEECERRGIPYEAIPVATIKKTATGKGNAKKDAMVEAARLFWPTSNITDDNEADARHIARHIVLSNGVAA
jgi:Holliday junction resolvasome RuvABC endonuclease subunit